MRNQYLEMLRRKVEAAYLKLHVANMADDVDAILFAQELEEAQRAMAMGESL